MTESYLDIILSDLNSKVLLSLSFECCRRPS